jgi:hypothetical protein
MLRLLKTVHMSDDLEITFEAPAPPTMTTELAVALAQLVRAALARQAERAGQVA